MFVGAIQIRIGLSRDVFARGAFALRKGIGIGHRDLPSSLFKLM
jgi:hypothetical protein